VPRSLWRDTVMVRGPGGAIPLAGATVHFYEDNGTPYVPIAFSLYPSATAVDPLRLPISTGSLGEIEIWADAPQRIRLVATKPGLSTADEVIDLAIPPETAASGGDVAQSISDHEAKENPHPQYATDADIAAHAADPAAHSQYLTQDEGDLRYVLASAPTEDRALREYVQRIMAVLDPGGAPPPPP
jgi:hypothetical protein